MDSSTSEPLPLGDKGVPQGSILGSLLFVISQVDLPFQRPPPPPPSPPVKASKLTSTPEEPRVQYVDGISDVIVDEEVTSLIARAESRASQTVEWLLDNGMVLSLHKSMFIV